VALAAVPWHTSEAVAADQTLQSVPVYSSWRTFTKADGLADDSIRSLRVHEGTLWIGTDYGLSRYDGTTFTTWTHADGLPDFPVEAIEVDPVTQDVWLGSWGGGLVRFTAGRFDVFSQLNSGVSGDVIFDVAVMGDRVWAATDGGVSRFEPFNDKWSLFDERRRDTRQSAVTSLLHHGGALIGNVWGTGLRQYDDRGGTWLTEPVVDPNGGVGMFEFAAIDGETHLWTVSRRDVHKRRYVDGSAEVTAVQGNLPVLLAGPAFVYDAKVDDDGLLWLGTEQGLLVLVDDSKHAWLQYAQDGDSLRVTQWLGEARAHSRPLRLSSMETPVRCLAFDGGALWVGTPAGLVRAAKPVPWSSLPKASPARTENPSRKRAEPKPVAPVVRRSGSYGMPPPRPSIAVYGPRNRTVRIPGAAPRRLTAPPRADHWSIEIAIERVNQQGGLSNGQLLHATTVPAGYARYGWTLPEDDIVYFQRQPLVVGIIGYMDQSRIIADAVTYRSDVPWMNVAPEAADPVSLERTDPWVFRCFANQPREQRMLLDHLIDVVGAKRIGAICTPGGDCERHLDWWLDHARARGKPLVSYVSIVNEDYDASHMVGLVGSLAIDGVDTVLTWADAATSAALLRSLRAAGSDATFVGGPALMDKAFTEALGIDAGSVIVLLGTDETDKGVHYAPFAERYSERALARRRGATPPEDAVRSYEAADHIVAAMDVAGCDRTAVRDQLRAMDRSATGELHYEKLHGPTRVNIARLDGGVWTTITLVSP